MSQKSSLAQPAQSVSRALTADNNWEQLKFARRPDERICHCTLGHRFTFAAD